MANLVVLCRPDNALPTEGTGQNTIIMSISARVIAKNTIFKYIVGSFPSGGQGHSEPGKRRIFLGSVMAIGSILHGDR